MLLAACGPAAAPASSPSPPSATAPAAKPAASAPASAAAKPETAAATPKLVVSYAAVIGVNLPEWLADSAGLFKKNGLDVELTYIESSKGMAALLSNQIQVTGLGAPETVSASAAGGDVVPVRRARTGAKGSPGSHTLVDLAALKAPWSNQSDIVQRSYIASHRDIVQKYVDFIVQAIALARKDKAQAIEVLRKYHKSDDTRALDATYDYFVHSVIPSLPYVTAEQV